MRTLFVYLVLIAFFGGLVSICALACWGVYVLYQEGSYLRAGLALPFVGLATYIIGKFVGGWLWSVLKGDAQNSET